MLPIVLVVPLALTESVAMPRVGVPSPPSPPPAQETPRVNRPPLVKLAKPSCVPPGGRLRVCAQVLDDSGVAEVRALFRAGGLAAFHSTIMVFEGMRYCAWLPAPLPQTRTIEVYVEGVDDEYELSRSRTESVQVQRDCVIPLETATTAPSAVRRTTPGQAPLPPGFDPASMRSQE